MCMTAAMSNAVFVALFLMSFFPGLGILGSQPIIEAFFPVYSCPFFERKGFLEHIHVGQNFIAVSDLSLMQINYLVTMGDGLLQPGFLSLANTFLVFSEYIEFMRWDCFTYRDFSFRNYFVYRLLLSICISFLFYFPQTV